MLWNSPLLLGSKGPYSCSLCHWCHLFPQVTLLKQKSNKSDNRTDADQDHMTQASQLPRHLPQQGLCPKLIAGRDRGIPVQGHGLWLTRGLLVEPSYCQRMGRALQSLEAPGSISEPSSCISGFSAWPPWSLWGPLLALLVGASTCRAF